MLISFETETLDILKNIYTKTKQSRKQTQTHKLKDPKQKIKHKYVSLTFNLLKGTMNKHVQIYDLREITL